ncbi:MAK10-like protein [Tanacetum coccineum]
MGDENHIRTLGDNSKPSHEGYKNTIELPIGNNVVPLRSDTIRLVQNGCSFHGLRSEDPNQHLKDFLKLVDSLDLHGENKERTHLRTIDQSAGGKLHDLNAEESWALLEDLALYDNKIWNDPRDFAKPVKAIVLPQDVLSTSDRRLIELENQVQRLMEAHLAPIQLTQVNKITTLCEICSGPHYTQYCMEDPEQAHVEYTSSRSDEAGDLQCSTHIHSSINAITIHPKQPEESQVNEPNIGQEEKGLVPRSSNAKFVCSKGDDGKVMFIEIIQDDDEPRKKGPNKGEGAATEEPAVEYFDTLPTRDKLTYHRYLMSGPIPSIFLKNPIITEGCHSNLKIPCNIGHVHIKKAYIDLNSHINIMTRMMYNWIMRRKLNPRDNANGGISNFTKRIKGMHVFVGNFTYVVYFMIVEDISSIIDPRLSQVVLGRPFIEISNMTHNLPEGVVRNEEDKRRGVDYIMSKILGFYKECLELGLEYVTGLDDEGEVTKKQSHKPKSEDTNQEKLYLLNMDLCGPMRVASVNRKKYILIIEDDYSRFTWVKFLASNDEAPDFIIKFLKMIQVRLNETVRNIRTDNGTEFANQTLQDYYEQVGISHETSVARTPQQNGVVERRNRTLVKAARTMLIFAQAPLFLWVKAIATSLFDEFFSPPASVASPVPVEEALTPVELTGSPSSTIIDQDAPSPSTSQTTPQSQSQTIPLSAEEDSHNLEVSHMSNDSYFGISIPETVSEESSLSDVIPTTEHSDAPISEHLSKWTKDHLLQNIIGAQALCFLCNECLFDANHAMCLIDHVNSMNVRDKSASKKNKKRKEWKPTGKVFNSVGYKWKPTERTFTLVGNACPLTRITTTNKVPLRVPIPLEVVAPKHVVTRVYTRRPKVPKSVPNSKPKVAKSRTANRMNPDTSQVSDTSVAPSSSFLIDCRLSKLFCGIWTRAAPST